MSSAPSSSSEYARPARGETAIAARVLICVIAGLVLGSSAHAADVTVSNPGFEELYLGSNLPAPFGGDVPTGAFPTGPPPGGWVSYFASGSPTGGQLLGVLNPGTTADHMGAMPCFPAGAPEGDNVALLFSSGDAGGDEYGISQQLAETLQADTIYTLSVEVGNIQSCAGLVVPFTSFFDLDGFPGYRVQLLAGGTVIGEDTGSLLPGEGLFALATIQITTASAPPQLGQLLEIRLINRNLPDVPGVDGLEVDFDDVQLDASAITAISLPRMVRWLLAALLLASGSLLIRPTVRRCAPSRPSGETLRRPASPRSAP